MQSWAGTSMATPFVSGAAALVWSAHPELTATQLANVLESTAQDLGAAGVDTRYGHGLVRPDLALAALGKPTPTPTPVPTPTPAPTSSPAPTTTPSPSTTPTPPPAVGSSLTIAVGSSSIRLGKATSLRGLLTPGSVHDVVRVYVIKPGAHTWSIWKTLYASSAVGAGGTRWSYTFKPTKRGTYKVRVRFLGNAVVLASASRTLSVRVR
jgi:subtilisin family serine protease